MIIILDIINYSDRYYFSAPKHFTGGVGFGGDAHDIVLSTEVNSAVQRQLEMDKTGLHSLSNIFHAEF